MKGSIIVTTKDKILSQHSHHGILDIQPEMKVNNAEQLGTAYTPGVAVLSKLLARYPELKNKYTMSGKLVAVVTDGTAVLGLGNIGPAGGLPVVEGKALLDKTLANVDAVPITVAQKSPDEVVDVLTDISQSFAGFHLEDIAAPRCFEIEKKLQEAVNIPVYHDDQEGTAIAVLAGLINSAKVVGKKLEDLKVVINGVGASGWATGKLLLAAGIKDLTLVDIDGPVHYDSTHYNKYQVGLAKESANHSKYKDLSEAVKDKDVFIGLSDADVLSGEQLKTMADQPIVFALANPKPEIDPAVAHKVGVGVMATGSSQYPNQVNNILVFPGLYKGLLNTDLKKVDIKLEIAIAKAIAGLVSQPVASKVIPGVFDDGVIETVAGAVELYGNEQDDERKEEK